MDRNETNNTGEHMDSTQQSSSQQRRRNSASNSTTAATNDVPVSSTTTSRYDLPLPTVPLATSLPPSNAHATTATASSSSSQGTMLPPPLNAAPAAAARGIDQPSSSSNHRQTPQEWVNSLQDPPHHWLMIQQQQFNGAVATPPSSSLPSSSSAPINLQQQQSQTAAGGPLLLHRRGSASRLENNNNMTMGMAGGVSNAAANNAAVTNTNMRDERREQMMAMNTPPPPPIASEAVEDTLNTNHPHSNARMVGVGGVTRSAVNSGDIPMSVAALMAGAMAGGSLADDFVGGEVRRRNRRGGEDEGIEEGDGDDANEVVHLTGRNQQQFSRGVGAPVAFNSTAASSAVPAGGASASSAAVAGPILAALPSLEATRGLNVVRTSNYHRTFISPHFDAFPPPLPSTTSAFNDNNNDDDSTDDATRNGRMNENASGYHYHNRPSQSIATVPFSSTSPAGTTSHDPRSLGQSSSIDGPIPNTLPSPIGAPAMSTAAMVMGLSSSSLPHPFHDAHHAAVVVAGGMGGVGVEASSGDGGALPSTTGLPSNASSATVAGARADNHLRQQHPSSMTVAAMMGMRPSPSGTVSASTSATVTNSNNFSNLIDTAEGLREALGSRGGGGVGAANAPSSSSAGAGVGGIFQPDQHQHQQQQQQGSRSVNAGTSANAQQIERSMQHQQDESTASRQRQRAAPAAAATAVVVGGDNLHAPPTAFAMSIHNAQQQHFHQHTQQPPLAGVRSGGEGAPLLPLPPHQMVDMSDLVGQSITTSRNGESRALPPTVRTYFGSGGEGIATTTQQQTPSAASATADATTNPNQNGYSNTTGGFTSSYVNRTTAIELMNQQRQRVHQQMAATAVRGGGGGSQFLAQPSANTTTRTSSSAQRYAAMAQNLHEQAIQHATRNGPSSSSQPDYRTAPTTTATTAAQQQQGLTSGDIINGNAQQPQTSSFPSSSVVAGSLSIQQQLHHAALARRQLASSGSSNMTTANNTMGSMMGMPPPPLLPPPASALTPHTVNGNRGGATTGRDEARGHRGVLSYYGGEDSESVGESSSGGGGDARRRARRARSFVAEQQQRQLQRQQQRSANNDFSLNPSSAGQASGGDNGNNSGSGVVCSERHPHEKYRAPTTTTEDARAAMGVGSGNGGSNSAVIPPPMSIGNPAHPHYGPSSEQNAGRNNKAQKLADNSKATAHSSASSHHPVSAETTNDGRFVSQNSDDFDAQWQIIASAIHDILEKRPARTSYQQLHGRVFALVVKRMGRKLYKRIVALLKAHIATIAERINASSEAEFVACFTDEYRTHVSNMKRIGDIMLYLDKNYCPQNGKPVVKEVARQTLHDVALGTFVSLNSPNTPSNPAYGIAAAAAFARGSGGGTAGSLWGLNSSVYNPTATVAGSSTFSSALGSNSSGFFGASADISSGGGGGVRPLGMGGFLPPQSANTLTSHSLAANALPAGSQQPDVFCYNSVCAVRICQFIANAVIKDRNGASVPDSVAASSQEMSAIVNEVSPLAFRHIVGEPMLASAAIFYAEMGQRCASEMSTLEFVQMLSKSIAAEQTRVQRYAHESLLAEMQTAVLHNFFTPQAYQILEHPPRPLSPTSPTLPAAAIESDTAGAWLQDLLSGSSPFDDLQKVLEAYVLSGETKPLVAKVKLGITSLGSAIALGQTEQTAVIERSPVTQTETDSTIGELKDARGMPITTLPKTTHSLIIVDTLLNFMESFTKIIGTVFISRHFARAYEQEELLQSLSRSINVNPRMAEYLAFAVDCKLRANCSESDMSVFCDRILKLYKLLDDKDAFDISYQYFFSQRLLSRYGVGGAAVSSNTTPAPVPIVPFSSTTAESGGDSSSGGGGAPPLLPPALHHGGQQQKLPLAKNSPFAVASNSSGHSASSSSAIPAQAFMRVNNANVTVATQNPNTTTGSNTPANFISFAADSQFQVLEWLFLRQFKQANTTGFGAKLEAMLNDCRLSESINIEFGQLMAVVAPTQSAVSCFGGGGGGGGGGLFSASSTSSLSTPLTANRPFGSGDGDTSGGESGEGGNSMPLPQQYILSEVQSMVSAQQQQHGISANSFGLSEERRLLVDQYCLSRGEQNMLHVYNAAFGGYTSNHRPAGGGVAGLGNSAAQTAGGSASSNTAPHMSNVPLHVRKGTIPHYLYVTILTKGHWPKLQDLRVFLPQETIACIEVFKSFYLTLHRSRVLEFALSQGTFEIRMRYHAGSAGGTPISNLQSGRASGNNSAMMTEDETDNANTLHHPYSYQTDGSSSSAAGATRMQPHTLTSERLRPPNSAATAATTTVAVHAVNVAKTVLLSVPTFVAIPLLLFEGDGCSHTVTEVAAKSGLPLEEAARAVAALLRQTSVCTSILRLKKNGTTTSAGSSTTSTTLTADTVVEYNTNFKSKFKFVKVGTAVLREKEVAAVKDIAVKARGRERSLELSAQIVKVMKAQQTISHEDLVREVKQAVAHIFVASAEDVKKGIESLIERDFLRREADSPSQYAYVA